MTILPRLERDLFNAAEDRLPAPSPDPRRQTSETRRPALRRLRASTAGLPVLLSVAVAIAIAVVALAAFKQGHRTANPRVPGSGIPAGTSPRQELIRTIGALRMPQRKADLNCGLQIMYLDPCGRHRLPAEVGPPQILARWGYPTVDRSLLRVVAIPAWGGKVLIAPTTYRPSAASRRRTEGINLVIRLGGTVGMTGTGPRPTSVAAFLRHGLTVFANGPNGETNRGAFLVPDGVTKITLGSFRLPPHSAPGGATQTALAAATSALQATATVTDNIAAVQLSIPAVTSPKAVSGLYGMAATAQATWLNSSGQTVRRTTTEVDLLVRIRGRPSPSRVRPGEPGPGSAP
jgi:hypothetical protein